MLIIYHHDISCITTWWPTHPSLCWIPGSKKNEKLAVLFEEWAASGEDWKKSKLVIEDKRQAQGERFSAMVDREWNQRKVQLTWDSQRHLQKQVGERAATSNNGAWAPRPSRQARYVAISHLWFQHWDRGSWWDFDQSFPNGRCVEWWSRPLTCQEERHTKEEEEEEDKGKVVKVQKERQTVFVIKFQFVQLQVCEHSLEQQQQQQEDQEIKKRQEEWQEKG